MHKYFIITVDAEPDNQWDTSAAETTENAKYISRFQLLCNRFGFKPVYLSDYVMLQDMYFIEMMKDFAKDQICEIGMHLHAWDTPPISDLDIQTGNRPYLIEYPKSIMKEKIETITHRLRDTFDLDIKTHRAGRWAVNLTYCELLEQYGYTVDCSITPHVDWSNTPGRSNNSRGSDYSHVPETPHLLFGTKVMEIPVTVRKIGRINALKSCRGTPRSIAKALLKGEKYWYRPALYDMKQMKMLYDQTKNEEYIEMMIHSSELMPGCSPYFPDEQSIEQLYQKLEELFVMVSETHRGITLCDYADEIRSRVENEPTFVFE